MRQTRARVDLGAVAGNYRSLDTFLREAARDSGRPAPRVIAVVKANAYGHGAERVARTLESAGAPMLAGTSSGGLTNPASLGATAAAFGATNIDYHCRLT